MCHPTILSRPVVNGKRMDCETVEWKHREEMLYSQYFNHWDNYARGSGRSRQTNFFHDRHILLVVNDAEGKSI